MKSNLVFSLVLLVILSFSGFERVLSEEESDGFAPRIWSLIDEMTVREKSYLLNSSYPFAVPRLNIPEYDWHNEALHGLVIDGVTVFPTAVALAATFDLDLMKRVGTAISDEGRVVFRQGRMGLNYWSPNMDIVRDPRWGRNQETYGEDPYLCSRMGVAFVRSMQGDDEKYLKTITSPKHFAVHSGPELLRFIFDPEVSERDIWETYMPPFKAVIEEGKSHSIMTAYSKFKGIPISFNEYLLRTVLREKWGFDGYVTTDCGALSVARWNHNSELSDYTATALAVRAGVDLECGGFYHDYMEETIARGILSESELDSTVFRVLRARFKLGLFDSADACKYNSIPDSMLESHQHRMLAIEAAKKSMVLLKNANNVLPLSDTLQSYFITGPNAHTHFEMLGSYGGVPGKYWTPFLKAFTERVKKGKKITHLKGSSIDGMLVEIPAARHFRTEEGELGLKAEFYSNANLEGEPVLTRIDTVIDYHWERISPLAEVKDGGAFSVRWSGRVTFDADGIYSFTVTSNDGARLYIDGKKIIDSWWEHGNAPFHGYDTVKGGVAYPIVLEYYFTQSYAHVTFEFGGDSSNEDLYENAKEIAKEHDITIFVGGNTSLNEMEMKDRTTMDLAKGQMRLLKKLKESGKPIILVLYTGSCMSINWADEECDAILNAWYGGQEAGIAVADILLGDYNPSGKLPVTFYKSDSELPEFTDYSMANRSYRYYRGDPLYEFGFGLSYTKFKYENIHTPIDNILLGKNKTIPIIYGIKNIGRYRGDAVTQLYVSNLSSTMEQPIKQLKGFSRRDIKPGQTIADTIHLNIAELYYYDALKEDYRVEPGTYEIQISASSKDVRLRDTIVIIDTAVTTKYRDIDNSEIMLYPNPSCDRIVIDYVDLRVMSLSLFDALGRRIKDYAANSKEIDVSDLPKGFYLLKVELSNRSIFRKILIE